MRKIKRPGHHGGPSGPTRRQRFPIEGHKTEPQLRGYRGEINGEEVMVEKAINEAHARQLLCELYNGRHAGAYAFTYYKHRIDKFEEIPEDTKKP